jgi:uncharacterized protein (DUF2062 family)
MFEELRRRRAELRERRKRLRRMLRPLPRRANVHRYPVVRWFADWARQAPWLWSYKHAHVAPALYVGSVLALLPLYGIQLLLAFVLAFLLRANLTVMVALQFITNPFTLVPVYGFTGWVGAKLLKSLGVGADWPDLVFAANALFVGGAVVGLGFALVIDVVWRLLRWEARRFREQLRRLEIEALEDAPQR